MKREFPIGRILPSGNRINKKKWRERIIMISKWRYRRIDLRRKITNDELQYVLSECLIP